MFLCLGARGGVHGDHGMMAAAMVYRVFAICKHGCCLLCYKYTGSYIEKGGELKWGNFHFLRLVARHFPFK
jgi:hypothetical protein